MIMHSNREGYTSLPLMELSRTQNEKVLASAASPGHLSMTSLFDNKAGEDSLTNSIINNDVGALIKLLEPRPIGPSCTVAEELRNKRKHSALLGENSIPARPLAGRIDSFGNKVKTLNQCSSETLSLDPSITNKMRKKGKNSHPSCSEVGIRDDELNDNALSANQGKKPVAPSTQYHLYQAQKWASRFQDLKEFKEKYGHCCVPHNFPENQLLAQWMKRQRSQYKLKVQGMHSTLSDDREQALQKLGFVWDSHQAAWMGRWNELRAYAKKFGHCRVPAKDPVHTQLGIWVKTQRRNYRIFVSGDEKKKRKCAMCEERIAMLEELGFEWDPRGTITYSK